MRISDWSSDVCSSDLSREAEQERWQYIDGGQSCCGHRTEQRQKSKPCARRRPEGRRCARARCETPSLARAEKAGHSKGNRSFHFARSVSTDHQVSTWRVRSADRRHVGFADAHAFPAASPLDAWLDTAPPISGK